jgi:hypothetical protein
MASRPCTSGFVRQQLREGTSEPNRLGRERIASAVPLVEDQVYNGEHCSQPLGQQFRRWDPERNTRRLDLALGAYQALSHRGLGHEKGAGQFVGRQSAERPQRQRDLRLERQRRMTAGKDQLQAFVGKARLSHRILHNASLSDQRHLGAGAVTADAVNRTVASGGHQPSARVGRDPVARPALGSDRKRLLCGFLGEFEVTKEADQGSNDPTPLRAENLLERSYQYTAQGRISIAPPSRAAGTRAASSIAASRSSASSTK